MPGDPPYDETNVELVEIDEPSAMTATVTACLVFNEVRVGADGIPVGETGVLTAATSPPGRRTHCERLAAGVEPQVSSRHSQGVTTCPAS